MSFKDKIMNIVISHPKLVTLSIGLGMTFAVAIAIPTQSASAVFEALFR